MNSFKRRWFCAATHDPNLRFTAGGFRALSFLLTAVFFSFAQISVPAETVWQTRFVDSATGYAIQPEYISVRSHAMGAVETIEDKFLEPGWYTFAVNSPQHQPMSGDFEVKENSRFEFMLDPIEPPRELQPEYIEKLQRDGAMLIQGFIVNDETGEALSEVRVKSLPSGAETSSDTRGFFQFYIPVSKDSKNDSANLIFEKHGYVTQERQPLELWSRGDSTYRIRLERGSGRNNVDERTLRRHEGLGSSIAFEPDDEDKLKLEPQMAEMMSLFSVEAASTVASNATVRVPRNIRVDKVGTIHYVTMNYYAKHVLPAEWIASWNSNSVNAGAVAVRSYAISRINSAGANSDFDICGTSTCQVFNPTLTHSATDRAVDYTEGYVMINNSGNIASTEYSAENNSANSNCGDGFTSPTGGCLYDPICYGQDRAGHGRGMCQRGSNRWATGARGFPQRDWIWILNHYYPNLRLVKGTPLVIGDDVRSRSSNCNVRACPGGGIENGVSCALITTKASGQTGVIIGGPVRVTADGKGFTWYQIQWNDANSTIGWSCENYIDRVFPTPTTPESLIATAVSTNQINLSWIDTSDVETNFEIERAPGVSGPWIEIGSVAPNVTSFSDRNLFSANTWFYRVRARNAAGTTSYTSVVNATTLGAVAPVLASIPDRAIVQGALFTFTAAATAPDRVNLIADFEPFMSETANGIVLFQTPTNSSTTRSFLNSAVNVGTNNLAAVVDTFPITGHTTGKVLRITCQFTNASNPWLRLTTDGAEIFPRPVIDLTRKLRFNIRSDRDIRVALGCRETTTALGTPIGSDGGISGAIEWVGVTGVNGTAPVATRSVGSNSWNTLTFDFANEPIRNFSGGNGILSTASGLGVLEHLAIVPTGGLGVYNIYLDNFAVVGPPRFTFSLAPGAPAGASIHPTTGVFTWTPTQNQSPSTNNISVIVADDSSSPLRATNTFTVIVTAPNNPPLLAPVESRTVHSGSMVTFTNFAYDPNPGDTLTFSLDPGAPIGASVHPDIGVFTWLTTDAAANTTNPISIRVTDSGSPPLSGTASLTVTVRAKPSLGPSSISEGAFTFNWSAIPNTNYRIEYKTNLNQPEWLVSGSVTSSGDSASFTDSTKPQAERYYRIIVIP